MSCYCCWRGSWIEGVIDLPISSNSLANKCNRGSDFRNKMINRLSSISCLLAAVSFSFLSDDAFVVVEAAAEALPVPVILEGEGPTEEGKGDGEEERGGDQRGV